MAEVGVTLARDDFVYPLDGVNRWEALTSPHQVGLSARGIGNDNHKAC